MKPILCLLLLSLCFSLLSAELLVIRIESPTPALVKSFYDQGYDIASYRPGEYLDLVVDEATYKSLKISFPGAYIHDSEEQMKSNLTSPDRTLPGYQTYPAILDSLSVLAQQYPDLLRIVNIGSSWGKYYAQEGHDNYEDFQHDIVAVILSDNAALDEDEPAFYYVGAHHAREPISSEVVMGILSHFLDGYGTDDEITALVDDNELWFIPVLNPDGHKIVLDQTYTMMRKNIRDNNQNHTIDINYDGVDLNRNYGFEWGFIGAIDNPSDQTYHGLGPFSELETVAFRDFLGQRHFLGGISYHSYGCLVLYPYGYISNLLAPDAQELAALGSQMASSIGYTCTPSWQLYPTSGNLDDYAYGTYGTFAYTIELSYIFIPPAIQIPTIVNANLAAAKLLASRRNYSVLTGKVTAADTGEALPAYIHVVGIDDSPVYRTPYRANQDFGSYWRFLPPGNYTVRYYLQGYQAQERQVSITETGITTEEVELSASEHIDLLISLKDTYGNPISGTCIEFLDTNIPDVCFGPEGTIFYHQFPTGHYRIRIIKDSFEPLNLYVPIYEEYLSLRMQNLPAFYDGFELNTDQWTFDTGWGLTDEVSYNGTGSCSDNPDGNNGSTSGSATCNYLIDLSTANSGSVSFWVMNDNPYPGGYNYFAIFGDSVALHNVDYFTGSMDWTLMTYPLTAYLGKVIQLKFGRVFAAYSEQSYFYIDDLRIFINQGSSVPNQDVILPGLKLKIHAYPNPFSQSVKLLVDNPPKGIRELSFEIYNLRGQKISTLDTMSLTEDRPYLSWNGRDFSGNKVGSGVYFLRAKSRGKTLITMKLLKIGA